MLQVSYHLSQVSKKITYLFHFSENSSGIKLFPFYKLLGFSRPKHHSLPQFTQHYHHSLKRAASLTEADLDFCGESL